METRAYSGEDSTGEGLPMGQQPRGMYPGDYIENIKVSGSSFP